MTELSLNASYPPEQLKSFIHSFNYFSCKPFHRQKCFQIPPGKGFILLIKHGEVSEKGNISESIGPGTYFGIPHIEYRYLEVREGAELLWLELEPTTLFQLSGRFINTFYGKIMPLQHLLSIQLEPQSSDFNLLDKTSLLDWISGRLFNQVKLFKVPACVQTSLKAFIQFEHNLSISGLCEKLQVNRRSFERKFLRVIGLSPKHYWRINRLSHAMSLLTHAESADLQDIVFQCGYFDQSHFIRDFKHLTGTSPRKYLLAAS